MPFDEHYIREVLEPARQAEGKLPEDLRVRYQLREPLKADNVTASVKQVLQCWRRQRDRLKFQRPLERLWSEHYAKYAPIFDAVAEGNLDPLYAELRVAGQREERRLVTARQRLMDAAGSLQMLRPGIVTSIAKSTGMNGVDAVKLAAELEIDVREPDRLPTASPYPCYDQVRYALDALGKRHIAAFLFGDDRKGIRVFGDTSEVVEKIDDVAREWSGKPRTATTNAQTILAALRSTSNPTMLLLYDITTHLRERIRENPDSDTLMRHVTDELGLDAGDARRLLFAVRHDLAKSGSEQQEPASQEQWERWEREERERREREEHERWELEERERQEREQREHWEWERREREERERRELEERERRKWEWEHRKHRRRRWLASLVAIGLFLGIAMLLYAMLHDIAVDKPNGPTACPQRIASALPSGEGASLIQAYRTVNADSSNVKQITLCKQSNGELYYYGEMLNQPEDGIAMPAKETDDGFIARNGSYRYEIIGGTHVVITAGKKRLGVEKLMPVPAPS